jgi:alpha-1,2-mannosyltransferase
MAARRDSRVVDGGRLEESRRRPSPFDVYGQPLLWIAGVIAASLAITGALAAPTSTDFNAFYVSGRALLEHRDPYVVTGQTDQTHLNPPAVTLGFLPLALVPLPIALAVFLAGSLAAMTFACMLIAKETAPGRGPVLLSVLLISDVGFSTLRLGEVGGLMMLLLTLAWLADRHDHPTATGAWLGVAIYAKIFLAPLAVYLIWRRSWVACRAMLTTAGLAVAIGMLCGGFSVYGSWFEALRRVGVHAHLSNASIYGVLARCLTRSSMPVTPLAVVPAVVGPLWIVLAACTAAWVVRALGRRVSLDREWSVLLIGSLLVSPLGWTYYLSMATGPVVASLTTARGSLRRLAAAGMVCFCVPLTIVLSNVHVYMNTWQTATVGSIFAVGTCLLLLAVSSE